MVGSTNVGGGGGSTIAFINTVYPAGSICTCSKSSKILTARDTSGSFMFRIPEEGTWALQCTDGTDTASTNVTVLTGRGYDATLAYWDGYVYYEGSEYAAHTGGWNVTAQSPNATAVKETTRIYLDSFTAYDGSYTNRAMTQTAARVDLTDFTSLTLTSYESSNFNNTYDKLQIYVSLDGVNVENGNGMNAFQNATGSTTEHTTVLDVSGLTGSYYVGVFLARLAGAGHLNASVRRIQFT